MGKDTKKDIFEKAHYTRVCEAFSHIQKNLSILKSEPPTVRSTTLVSIYIAKIKNGYNI